jgi:hypothetical protein
MAYMFFERASPEPATENIHHSATCLEQELCRQQKHKFYVQHASLLTLYYWAKTSVS